MSIKCVYCKVFSKNKWKILKDKKFISKQIYPNNAIISDISLDIGLDITSTDI